MDPPPTVVNDEGGGWLSGHTHQRRQQQHGTSVKLDSSSAAKNTDRISRLSQRINSLQAGIESERSARFEHVQAKLDELEREVANFQTASADGIANVKDEIGSLMAELKAEREVREAVELEGQEELLSFEERMRDTVETEQARRRDAESKLLKQFEERSRKFEEEMKENLLAGKEQMRVLREHLDIDIPKLYESLKNESKIRDENEMRIVRKATHEITRLEELLAAEKASRAEFERVAADNIEHGFQNVQRMLEEERESREVSHNTLLALVEDACAKLDAATRL